MNIKIIELENIPINKQLEIEKNLLTSSKQTILLINKNPPPAIVLGSSQKIDEVVDKKKASEKQIPIIQRFSAGGCVIFDINTILVTFIMNNDDINDEIYPNTIMKWTEKFYKQSLPIEDFQLTANDYTIGNKKVGGNAQYIKKNRFLHHTSFLWDYSIDHMNILTHPPKEPAYRNSRQHHEFLTTLKDHMTKEEFIGHIKDSMKSFTPAVQQDQISY